MVEMTKVVPNISKLAEMTHYIIYKCQPMPHFGKTVLYKLLYFSDFNHYKKYFGAISNEEYRKLEFGPAPSHFDNALDKLTKDEKVEYFAPKKDGDAWIFKPLKKPETTLLNNEELQTIDKVLKKLGCMNATKISKLSHEDNPYKSSKLKEIIDYNLVFYRDEFVEKQVE